MNLDSQSSEDRAKWTPERPQLVIDVKKKINKAEWTKKDSVENDSLEPDERVTLRAYKDEIAKQNQEKARRAAIEKALPAEPSIDDAERAKLDGMRAKLEELRAAGQAIPKWKRVAEQLGIGSDVSRNRERIAEAERRMKDQEFLVGVLSVVPTFESEIAAVRAASDSKKFFFLSDSAQPLREVFRALGNKEIASDIGRRLADQFDADRRVVYGDPLMDLLKNRAAGGNPVDRKWTQGGMRLLAELYRAGERRNTPKNRFNEEMKRLRESGPMELLENGRWVPLSEVPSSGEHPRDNDLVGSETLNHPADSQGEEIAA